MVLLCVLCVSAVNNCSPPATSHQPLFITEHTLKSQISYGKMQIPLYRTYAAPMSGVKSIPESGFTGRNNILFAAEVDVEVFGDNFMPAYTDGDNSNV